MERIVFELEATGVRRLTADELRELYLSFFEEKGHKRLPGASLVPHGDPTLLLTAAGMVPFKPYFLGQEEPKHRRITTCQRCLRTPDIEHVGKTDRHATFFEMLGNFSFGDYFKKEAIEWAWEFVTKHLELSPDDLWATIYLDDDEAFEIWTQVVGLPADRIVRLGREDNFWEIGVGPCGPCSEIFVDRGEKFGCGEADCRPGCSRCERFFEIWNLVFIQYNQDSDGNLLPLENKGIDTGMGLERTAAFLQGVGSIFEIDSIRPIIDFVADAARVKYGDDPETDVSLRVITDHMRGVTLLIMDGVLPSNEGRGYVLRRLLRRAARHARLLGIEDAFLTQVAQVVAKQLGGTYPPLVEDFDAIARVISIEEARFHETLDQGIDLLNRLIQQLESEGKTEIPGEEAFRLYDTYGFPFELTEEIAAGRGFTVDQIGFQAAMERQRTQARAARAQTGYLGDMTDQALANLDLPATQFLGYEQTEAEAKVLALLVRGARVDSVSAELADEIEVVLDVTPFYPEGGGQIADNGTITGRNGVVQVGDVRRVGNGVIVHRGRIVSGELAESEHVVATVDAKERWDTARNHTGTHLLHKALHEIVGNHAKQAGSLVAPDRLRFDFTHFQPLTPEEIAAIEERVNARILENLPVTTAETTFEEATQAGAVALFGEKYGDRVRVVSIGEYSKELCGGTHVRSSGDLGLFKIVTETGVASGVRRIEAVTGDMAHQFVRQEEEALHSAARRLQVAPLEVPRQVERLFAQLKSLEREIASLKDRLSNAQTAELAQEARDVGGMKVLTAQIDGADMEAMRKMGDILRQRLGSAAIVLGSAGAGKAQIVVMVTKDVAERGLKANELIRRIAPFIEGGGGGHAEMAQAGGKAPERLAEALAEAERLLASEVKSV